MTFNKLRSFLSDVPSGAIPASRRDHVLELVVASWPEFPGSGDTSMAAWKIRRDGGPDDLTWEPPHLSFCIVRHGAAAFGSSRGERQQWTLDLERRTVDQCQIGFRQLFPNAPRLDVKSIADRVCRAVQEGPRSASESDPIFVWKNDDELIVFHGKLVGGDNKQTISGRRRRFIADLKAKMEIVGWEVALAGRGLKIKRKK
jgi:hypothetical protein